MKGAAGAAAASAVGLGFPFSHFFVTNLTKVVVITNKSTPRMWYRARGRGHSSVNAALPAEVNEDDMERHGQGISHGVT
jgi:hypothetical protein